LGYGTVLGVDASQTLLTELATRAAQFPAITPIHADLSTGLEAIVQPESVTTAVCMGDTLPHLPDRAAVKRLLDDVHAALIPDGRFVLSFRSSRASLKTRATRSASTI